MRDNSSPSSPYKPVPPRIPGVPEAIPESGQTVYGGRRSAAGLWVGIAGAVVVAIMVAIVVDHWIFDKPKTEASAQTAPVPAASEKPASDRPDRATERILEGPGPIAKREDLAKLWSSKRFDFRDEVAGTVIHALVVHLPGGVYWGFSLREPYGTCTLQYVTDLDKIQSEYNYTSSYPLVADPCNQSLFDLTQYGGGPTGMVRGQIVQGRAVRPPMAIEMRVKGDDIIAVRSE